MVEPPKRFACTVAERLSPVNSEPEAGATVTRSRLYSSAPTTVPASSETVLSSALASTLSWYPIRSFVSVSLPVLES